MPIPITQAAPQNIADDAIAEIKDVKKLITFKSVVDNNIATLMQYLNKALYINQLSVY